MFYNHFRYLIAVLILMSTTNIYICRLNLSTAIVKMAKEDSPSNITSSSNSTVKENLRWSEQRQDVILGAFFYGYFALQAVSGRLSELFGPRLLCFLGLFGSGLINLLTPLVVDFNDNVFIAVRVLLGTIQSFVFPSCYALASKWMPDNERSTVLSLTTIGGSVGTMIASSMSGYLSEHHGWRSVFYVSGSISLVSSLLYYLIVRNDPGDHCLVSKNEEIFIKSHILNIRHNHTKRPPFPWKKIFTSVTMYSSIIAKFASMWFYSILALKVPTYMDKVMKISLEKNGYFSSIIFSTMSISNLASGMLADTLIKRNILKKPLIRKIFETVALVGSALFLSLIPVLNVNEAMFLVLMASSVAMLAIQAGGEMPIYADLSNEFSATLFGMANMVAMTTGFISPLVIGAILDANTSNAKQQWAIIFYLTSGLNIIGAIAFAIFVEAKRQDWDIVDEIDKPEE